MVWCGGVGVMWVVWCVVCGGVVCGGGGGRMLSAGWVMCWLLGVPVWVQVVCTLTRALTLTSTITRARTLAFDHTLNPTT